MTENAPPGGVDEFLTKMGLADESMLNYVTIEPEPAFVAKTVDGIGKKFFLNVCGHEAVDKPRPLEGSDRVTTEFRDLVRSMYNSFFLGVHLNSLVGNVCGWICTFF